MQVYLFVGIIEIKRSPIRTAAGAYSKFLAGNLERNQLRTKIIIGLLLSVGRARGASLNYSCQINAFEFSPLRRVLTECENGKIDLIN